jgi:hypothetical protein
MRRVEAGSHVRFPTPFKGCLILRRPAEQAVSKDPQVPGGGKKKQRVDLSGRRHCQYWPSPDIAAFECGIISPFSST